MLKNFWYACEFSSAVTNKPKQLLMLNQKFVLYRDSQGKPVVLKDKCPHRGVALSMGKVKDDCIVCPYHGWKFQGDGACVEIPANKPGTPIPKKAVVDSYPVQEKYGFIWMFYGDLPEQERPPIPALPEFEDPNLRKTHFEQKVDINYTRSLEGKIDFAHFNIVHQNSFGYSFPSQLNMEDYEYNSQDWGAYASINAKSYTNAGRFFRYILPAPNSNVKMSLSFYMPNITKVDVDFGRGKFVIFTIHLPVDDNKTIIKRIQFRNCFKFRWADTLLKLASKQVAIEDKIVVETQERAIPNDLAGEIHIAWDTLSIAHRKLYQKCMAMGWGLKPNQSQAKRQLVNY